MARACVRLRACIAELVSEAWGVSFGVECAVCVHGRPAGLHCSSRGSCDVNTQAPLQWQDLKLPRCREQASRLIRPANGKHPQIHMHAMVKAPHGHKDFFAVKSSMFLIIKVQLVSAVASFVFVQAFAAESTCS